MRDREGKNRGERRGMTASDRVGENEGLRKKGGKAVGVGGAEGNEVRGSGGGREEDLMNVDHCPST